MGYKNRFFCLYIFIHSRNPRFFDTLFFYDIQNSSPCVTSTKNRISGLYFLLTHRFFIQFCLYQINFLHFWDTLCDTKTDFLVIHFYTVFIYGRNLRLPAHCFLNDMQNATPYVIFLTNDWTIFQRYEQIHRSYQQVSMALSLHPAQTYANGHIMENIL